MEDYDPIKFHKTRGDVAGAWAVCTILFAAIFFGSYFSSNADHDPQNDPLAMTHLPDVVRVSGPGSERVASCE